MRAELPYFLYIHWHAAAHKLSSSMTSSNSPRNDAQEYEPEFKPPAGRKDEDARNFDAEFTSERAVDSVVTTTMSEAAKNKTNFKDFTFAGDSEMAS